MRHTRIGGIFARTSQALRCSGDTTLQLQRVVQRADMRAPPTQ